MGERQADQLRCAFNSSTICPEDCRLNSFRQTMRSIKGSPPGMATDVLNERKDVYTKLCDHKRGQLTPASGIQTLKATIQEHLQRV